MFARSAMRYMQGVQTEQELKSHLIRVYKPSTQKLESIKKDIDAGVVTPFWCDFYTTWEDNLNRKIKDIKNMMERQEWLNQLAKTGFKYPFFNVDSELLKWAARTIPKDPTQYKLPYPQTTINVGNFRLVQGDLQILNLSFTALQADKTGEIFTYAMMGVFRTQHYDGRVHVMKTVLGIPIFYTFQEYMSGHKELFGVDDPTLDILQNERMPMGSAIGLNDLDVDGKLRELTRTCLEWLAGFMALVNLRRGTTIKNQSSVHQKNPKAKNPPKGYTFHTLELEPSLKEEFSHQLSHPHGSPSKHWVRGHFKTYKPEAPLLGKITGVIWWAAHQRGEEGFADKEYNMPHT